MGSRIMRDLPVLILLVVVFLGYIYVIMKSRRQKGEDGKTSSREENKGRNKNNSR